MGVRRVVAPAVLVLLASGLAACAGDDDPQPKFSEAPASSSPTDEPSASESSGDTGTEPTTPPELERNDEAGA